MSQPLMKEPVLIFRLSKTRVKNEYWIFDIRVTNPVAPGSTYHGSRWPFLLVVKNSRGGWKPRYYGATYNKTYAYAQKQASAWMDKGYAIEKMEADTGSVGYVAPPLESFLVLVDRAKNATPTNRMNIIKEIDAVLALVPVLEELRQQLSDREFKRLGI